MSHGPGLPPRISPTDQTSLSRARVCAAARDNTRHNTMGWKATAAGKRVFCASATKHVTHDAATAVFDMNAVLRKECVYGPDVSPAGAAAMFWQRHVRPSAATTFYFAFDNPSKIPQARLDFHATDRYKNSAVILGPAVVAHKPLGMSWAEAWKTTSKGRMWTVIAAALYDKVLHAAKENVTYIVDPPDGDVMTYPEDTPFEPTNFGEADCRCAMFVKNIPNAVVHTIDWDMVIQGVFLFQPGTVVHVGSVWKGDVGGKLIVAFSKKNAPKNGARVPEVIEPARLGGGHRTSLGFGLLCMAGVDYCGGLKRFGYREADMLALLRRPVPKFFVVEEGPPMKATLDVNALVKWLRAVTITRPREKSVGALNEELRKILFCALYFAGFDRMAERGGPTLPAIDFFGGVFGDGDPAFAALRPTSLFTHYADVLYTEKSGSI